MAEISKGLYELCQASQLVLFLTSPKITRTDMDFCFGQCLKGGAGEEGPGAGFGLREVYVGWLWQDYFPRQSHLISTWCLEVDLL